MRGVALLALSLAMASLLARGAYSKDYELIIDKGTVTIADQAVTALTINGALPGPLLRLKEGEEARIHVTNKLDEETSLHWHGLLLPGAMDGVPGFSGFEALKPGERFTYRFTPRQSGTYWYHSHSGFQEQEGLYGPLIVDPVDKREEPVERDYIVMLSDFTKEDPKKIWRHLKVDGGYYNYSKRTLGDFFKDANTEGLSKTVKDRLSWGRMRMDPTDLADVTGYTFLMNGKASLNPDSFLFEEGDKVRLRFINGSAMTYFDVRIPGLKMTVVQADGRDVQPVPVDEFRIAVAETYDVIVEPEAGKAYSVIAESLDRTGFAQGFLTPNKGLKAKTPARRARSLLSMADMPQSMMPSMEEEHDMSHMHHSHGSHDMGVKSAPQNAKKEKAEGWASGFPKEAKVLSYADLKSRIPNDDLREPSREIKVALTGNMERYIWSLDNKKYKDAKPIELIYGERVKLTFENETMMAHPMHLHGMFVELDNGQTTHRPEKHVVNVPPGGSYSVLITADEPGEWAFHCHLLYHMASGMMRKVVVARMTAEVGP